MRYEEADVVVIGGGIMGCSISYELLKRSRSVILLERGFIGGEASGRNGGGVRQQNRDPAELPLAMEAVKIWNNMKEELEWDVEYRRNGNLHVITGQDELKKFEEKLKIENELGLDSKILDPDETRKILPEASIDFPIIAGKYCPSDGSANPLLVNKAISRGILRKGGRIHEHEPVEKLTVQSGRLKSAITRDAEYHAPVFVNATGAWARKLCNMIGLGFPLEIKKGQILITEPLPPVIKVFITASEVGYARQAISGGIHLGIPSTPLENEDKSTTLSAFINAGKRYTKLFPFLMNTNIIHSWAGLTHWTPDHIPILDKLPDLEGVFLCSGFSGHGFCLGPAVGKLIAEWITEGRPSIDLTGFGWKRFQGYIDEGKKTSWI